MRDNDYLFDLFQQLGASEFVAYTLDLLFSVLLTVVGAAIAARVGGRVARRAVESLVARSTLPGMQSRGRGRAEALGGVAASAVRLVVWFTAALVILGQFQVNLGPMLAGAGVVGVAIGFGAQSLVRDFLSGFFVLAEDQYRVGDVVTLGDTTGAVEEVNLRTTRLRDSNGTVWFVPNGEIRKVGNSAKDWARAVVDVIIPVGADLTLATTSITEELATIGDDPELAPAVLEGPQLLGVESMTPDGLTIRVTAKTTPGERSQVARALRARIGARLVHAGVIPAQEVTTSGDD
ncbi:MAG: mechanosensitive ion channel family protein [Actinomycetota bacterium]|nr:mechanosensitive ion channel family protein [Actinomycetota bacterium]